MPRLNLGEWGGSSRALAPEDIAFRLWSRLAMFLFIDLFFLRASIVSRFLNPRFVFLGLGFSFVWLSSGVEFGLRWVAVASRG